MDHNTIEDQPPGTCWVGIDTHRQFHIVAVTDADGRHLLTRRFETQVTDLDQAAQWITTLAPAGIGIEGTSSYGAVITRALLLAEQPVWEVSAPNKVTRYRHGKSDQIDAYAAAEAVRTQQRISPVKDLRLLPRLRTAHVLRATAMTSRTQVTNQIYALAPILDVEITGTLTTNKVRALTDHPDLGPAAQRWLHLTKEIATYDRTITAWLTAHAAPLLNRRGIGPDSATKLILAAGANPERLTTEKAFAHLTGVAPIPCSSGKHQRMRLNRGGDRDANNALWRIAFTRYHDPTHEQTQAYRKHRLQHTHATDEKSIARDTIRRLKRAIVREIFPDLKTIAHTITTT